MTWSPGQVLTLIGLSVAVVGMAYGIVSSLVYTSICRRRNRENRRR